MDTCKVIGHIDIPEYNKKKRTVITCADCGSEFYSIFQLNTIHVIHLNGERETVEICDYCLHNMMF